MKIQIKNYWSGVLIFETDAETIGDAVKAALIAKANLSDADLRSANLSDADLRSANLRSANLSDANLRSADLRSADLSGADLSGANLSGANLRSTNLSGADLSGANLSGANLRSANLSDANLRSANLRSANLSDANLRSANLRSADLSGANLSGKDLAQILTQRTILPAGDLIGWKRLSGGIICKLRIPAKAKRIGGLIGRKCRAEYAIVLEGEGVSQHDGKFTYKKGKRVKPDKYDPDPLVECSNGIHFFITKEEAEAYA